MMKHLMKKISSCIMAATLLASLLTSVPCAAQSEVDLGLGDVSRDGVVGLDDAQSVLKSALKIDELLGNLYSLADVNEDEKVDLADAQLVLKAALKIIFKFDKIERSDEYYDRKYADVLNQYYCYLEKEYDIDGLFSLTKSGFFTAYVMMCTLDDMGYVYYDVDGNGTKELLIGFVDMDDIGGLNVEFEADYFISIYSLDEKGRVTRTQYTNYDTADIVSSGRDSAWFICQNGIFGMATHYGHGVDFYRYDGEENLLHFTDGTNCVLNDECELFVCHKVDVHGNWTEISFEEKASLENRYTTVELEFKPFRQWRQ